jgi:oligosaccharide translocation protein RFT1
VTLNALTFFNYLLRFVVLVSAFVIAFGIPYSRFLLNVYGGSNLTDGSGPSLLRFYCVYLLFLAVNGLTEAFAQATMSIEQLKTYQKRITVFALLYLFVFYVLLRSIGIHGILVANCLNMSARIVTNSYYIYRYFPAHPWTRSCSFSPVFVTCLVACCALCTLTEPWLINGWLHFAVGCALGLLMLTMTWREEREMIHYIYCIVRLTRNNKTKSH